MLYDILFPLYILPSLQGSDCVQPTLQEQEVTLPFPKGRAPAQSIWDPLSCRSDYCHSAFLLEKGSETQAPPLLYPLLQHHCFRAFSPGGARTRVHTTSMCANSGKYFCREPSLCFLYLSSHCRLQPASLTTWAHPLLFCKLPSQH